MSENDETVKIDDGGAAFPVAVCVFRPRVSSPNYEGTAGGGK